MKVNIKDIEEITGCEYHTIIIHLKSQKKPVEANGIEFDHEAGTATISGIIK